MEAAKVGLHYNAKKTEIMHHNQDAVDNSINSISGESIKVVTNPKYLGSWMESTLKDVRVGKAY